MRRRTALQAGLTLGASGLMGGQRAFADSTPYFPPGSRLGFRKPDLLAPRTGDDRNQLAPDHTFQVMIAEPVVLGEPYDGDVWNQALQDAKLVSSTSASATEERRLFELTAFAGDPDHSWRTLIVRTTDALGRPDWFGELILKTQPLNAKIGQRARWRGEIDAILASVVVRPALSVAEMLREHGLGMDLSGLHPHHFGSKLTVSLDPPTTVADRSANDCYIAMESPPTRLPYPRDETATDAEVRRVIEARLKLAQTRPAAGAMSVWVSNGVQWIADGERPIEGTDMHVREMQGFGARRFIELRSYCRRGDRRPVRAALERVARSVTLDR